MSEPFERFKKHRRSPIFPEGEEGILITVDEQPDKRNSLVLRGICQISEDNAKVLNDTIFHNVSLVCSFGPDLVSVGRPLIRHEIIFSEDILRLAGYQTGFFNLDIKDLEVPPGQDPYFLVACFHNFLSDMLQFTWRN